MYSRAVQNLVLFSQHREHGFKSTWKGLKKMALHELLTVCTSSQDFETFREGFECFVRDEIAIYCSEELACYLLQNACPELPVDAVNSKKKWHLLFELFKKHGLETLTTPLPSFTAIIHEILNISAKSCDVNEVARNVLLKIAASYDVYDEAPEEYQAAISYLAEHRGVNVNALDTASFSSLLLCLKTELLHFCCVFSTPTTSVFLHTKLGAEKINLLWASVLKHLPSNLCSGSVDVIRSFVTNGFDIKDALFAMNFSSILISDRCSEESLKDFLEILEIFMDHGARLNPLPDSNELPFLHGVLKVYSEYFCGNETRPKLYGFITKCIQRGVDPKSSHAIGRTHRDLLSEVCALYDADDKDQLIEYLCDCGADNSLYRNNGLDLWAQLSYRSEYELAQPRSNEILLFLLRRGLRTDCIDEQGNNVLHKYFHSYLYKLTLEGCCHMQWVRKLDDLKFWDVLSALLDAGVQVSHVNSNGEMPVDVFTQIVRRNIEDCQESVCSKCSQIYIVEPPSFAFGKCIHDVSSIDLASSNAAPCMEQLSIVKATVTHLNAQLRRATECMERLSLSSHQPT